MPGPIGGLRDRLIHESLYRLVRDALLDNLGWGAPGRAHLPLNVVRTPVDPHTDVPLNTMTVTPEDIAGEPYELGSHASVDTHPFWVDFYGENEDVAGQVIGDVREILRGKIAGRTAPVLDVYDFDLATPVVLFSCVLEDVRTHRAHEVTRAHEQHWRAVSVDVVDEVD